MKINRTKFCLGIASTVLLISVSMFHSSAANAATNSPNAPSTPSCHGFLIFQNCDARNRFLAVGNANTVASVQKAFNKVFTSISLAKKAMDKKKFAHNNDLDQAFSAYQNSPKVTSSNMVCMRKYTQYVISEADRISSIWDNFDKSMAIGELITAAISRDPASYWAVLSSTTGVANYTDLTTFATTWAKGYSWLEFYKSVAYLGIIQCR